MSTFFKNTVSRVVVVSFVAVMCQSAHAGFFGGEDPASLMRGQAAAAAQMDRDAQARRRAAARQPFAARFTGHGE